MSASHEPVRIGEVVETSTVRFVVECDEIDGLPELGSFVRVAGVGVDAVYGVVAYAETGAIDPGRRVVRRGSPTLQDRALYEANPELRFVLRSIFVAVAVAFERTDDIVFLVPPYPPPLHYSVEAVGHSVVARLTARAAYLPLLVQYEGPVPPEQLIAAHLRYVYEARGRDREWLENAAREVARLLKRDYDRFSAVLNALEGALGNELRVQ
ncbi:MAG: hypothetical protein RMK01_02510 [Thermomicrobium sp.]|nr:hypothetical protein [Thermomicrobium sp.]MDW8058928.1 hypothetical protein [Thermomicrobium sp.]